MSVHTGLTSITAVTLTGFVFLSSIFLDTGLAEATELQSKKTTQTCTCPGNKSAKAAKPKFAKIAPRTRAQPITLTTTDRAAALESVQFALSEVGDGGTYVWHRGHGQLSGIVKPTASFRDADGDVCRHVVIRLTSGTLSRKTEAIACRLKSGIWELDG